MSRNVHGCALKPNVIVINRKITTPTIYTRIVHPHTYYTRMSIVSILSSYTTLADNAFKPGQGPVVSKTTILRDKNNV